MVFPHENLIPMPIEKEKKINPQPGSLDKYLSQFYSAKANKLNSEEKQERIRHKASRELSGGQQSPARREPGTSAAG